jgi:hypothetical protein
MNMTIVVLTWYIVAGALLIGGVELEPLKYQVKKALDYVPKPD